jgi:hypothetical protein
MIHRKMHVTATLLGVLGASLLAMACQEGARPLTQTRGGLEFHYESPTRTTITLTGGVGHDITVTVDRADQAYSLDVHQQARRSTATSGRWRPSPDRANTASRI